MNKRHIQVLDYHLHAYLHSGSDAKVINTYVTGSWTIVQPALCPCTNGECGLYGCSQCTKSTSSALTDVTFLHLNPREPSSTVPAVPLGPGAWGGEDEDPLSPGIAAPPRTEASGVASSLATGAAPTAAATAGPQHPAAAVQRASNGSSSSHGTHTPRTEASRGAGNACPDASRSASPAHTRQDSLLEEMLEEGGFTPPHGLLSMEFRRVRGDPACMTERVRRAAVNSIPAQIASFGEGMERQPGAITDACTCLEGLWCALSVP